MKHLLCLPLLLPLLLVAQPTAEPEVEQDPEAVLNQIVQFQQGPIRGDMVRAQIEVPEGYRFTGPEGTQMMMRLTGNIVSENEIGFIMPSADSGDDRGWFLVFEFSEVGYVKDDDKDSLDADKMFQQMRENEKAANKYRAENGMDTLEIQRWVIPPRYNPETNNLEWATELLAKPGNTLGVNYNVRLLGRNGYVEATLVCNPAQLESLLPTVRDLLATFGYKSGEKYAEFRQGDKIAQYGLTGLVVGGAVAAAARSGLLGRMLKPLLLGVLAVGAGIKRLFTGKRG